MARIVIKRATKPGLPRPPVKRGPPRGRRRWVRPVLYTTGALGLAGLAAFAYLYVTYSRIIDARLHGERERSLPRVFARPMELRRGQGLSPQDLIVRLNDLGYAQRDDHRGADAAAGARCRRQPHVAR